MSHETHDKVFAVTEQATQTGKRYDFTEDVERAAQGSEEAFESLYWKAFPYLEAEARKFFPKPEDAEDALQETYIKIYEKLGQLKEPNAFLGWALSVCKRTCMNRQQTLAVHTGQDELRPTTSEDTEGDFQEGLDLLPADEYRRDLNPDAYADSAHVNETVREVLDALPDMQQASLLLWMQGYSAREVADELDLPLGTAKSNIKYGKDKVKKVLEQMRREGTFDYKAVHADPVGAFLYLLEQYFSQARALPPVGDSLLKALKPAIGAGLSTGAGPIGSVSSATAAATESTTRSTAARAAVRKFLRDPATSVVSIVLVVALAIGVSVGIQAFSANTPAVEREDPSVIQSADRVPSDDSTSTTVSANGASEAEGSETNSLTNPSPNVPTPASANGQTGGSNSGNNTAGRQQTAGTDTFNNGRLTATVMENPDAGNIAGGLTGQVLGNVFSALGPNTAGAQNSMQLNVSDPTISNGNLVLDGILSNYLSSPAVLNSLDDLVLKNMDGEIVAKASFNMDKPLTIESGQYAFLTLSFPKGWYNEERAKAIAKGDAKHNPNVTVHLNYTKQSSENSTTNIGRGYKIAGTPNDTTLSTADGKVQLYEATLYKKSGTIYLDVSVQNLTGKKVKLYRIEDLHVNSGWVSEIISGDVILDSPIVLANKATCRMRMEFPESAAKRDSISDSLLYLKYNAIYEYID